MFSIVAKCFNTLTKRESREVKILILGLDNAGKSTIINDLKGEAKDLTVPTIGFSSADIKMHSFKITVYDVGGGPHIRGIWKDYYAEIYGMVYVVDASDLERIQESRTVLKDTLTDTRLAGKPFVMFANKQDKEGALSEMDIEHQFELEQLSVKTKSPFKVFQCTAFMKNGSKVDSQIKKGVSWLLQTMKNDFDALSDRVQKESEIQKEKKKKERAVRWERVKKAREERDRAEKEAQAKAEEGNSQSDDDDVVFGNVLPKVKRVSKKKRQKDASEEITNQNKDVESRSTDVSKPVKTQDQNGNKDVVDNDVNQQANGELKKKKKKKKKKRTKRNRTAPAPLDDDDSDGGVVLKPIAWRTLPTSLNGLPPKGRMLEPIRPPLHKSLQPPSRASTISEEDDDDEMNDYSPRPRSRPNGEDSEIIT